MDERTAEFLGESLALFGVEVHNNDLGTALRETTGGGLTEARGATGDTTGVRANDVGDEDAEGGERGGGLRDEDPVDAELRGDRLPIGLPEILRTAPRERLVSFYQKWYRTDRMAVVIVGDVDGADAEKMKALLDALDELDDVQDVYTTAALQD